MRFDHRDKKGCAYCDRGPSLLVNQTLVSEYFRGMDPENARAALILGDAWAGRAGVGE